MGAVGGAVSRHSIGCTPLVPRRREGVSLPMPVAVLDWCLEILRLARLNELAQAWPKSFFLASSPEGVVI
jgi:hypothetical protein